MTAHPQDVRRQCAGKDRHGSERSAQRALANVRLAGRDEHRRLHAYACPVCGGWHLGHRPGSGRHQPEHADGLSVAMEELLWTVVPSMHRSATRPGATWHLGDLRQDDHGRWQALLQGPTRAKQVWSNRNCRTAAAAVRDLVAKARASRWYAPHEIGGHR